MPWCPGHPSRSMGLFSFLSTSRLLNFVFNEADVEMRYPLGGCCCMTPSRGTQGELQHLHPGLTPQQARHTPVRAERVEYFQSGDMTPLPKSQVCNCGLWKSSLSGLLHQVALYTSVLVQGRYRYPHVHKAHHELKKS